ncbi:MAG: NAD(P)-dependent glycerol-3-phosphate dehydrogenase [Deltaproteobacteria bacterium]|jgi:glycerol-3-phosphate dehydrogenase (NAD(P)+)|nr:NAD(P)-dependent glycerol-3-phosphate dehydrogenase [Deltaproteobacteria bacterium]
MNSDNRKLGKKVAVIGAGAWGTTLALHAARQGLKVTLWARSAETAKNINADGENRAFLPGAALAGDITATPDAATALEGAGVVIWAVPSHGLRDVARALLPRAGDGTVHVSATKGIEDGTFMTMTNVLLSETPGGISAKVGQLSGPSFAKEVALGLPTAVTLGMEDTGTAAAIQTLLSSPTFRIYTTPDVLGVELGGALKNVYAIAAGICDGLELGLNARAAFLTRALSEMTRFAVAMGAHPLTLSGLSGMGDLILTATGELSRNRRVGLGIGAGESLGEILKGRRDVAEGVKNAKSLMGLSKKTGFETPTATEVYRVLYEGKNPKQAMVELLTRKLKTEINREILEGVVAK